MGLFGNIFKPLQGKLTAKQEENMKKVAEVFKEKTGKDYQTAVVWKMTTKKKLTKTVHTYYNWLMGYGIDDNNIPEIVPVSYTHLVFASSAGDRHSFARFPCSFFPKECSFFVTSAILAMPSQSRRRRDSRCV